MTSFRDFRDVAVAATRGDGPPRALVGTAPLPPPSRSLWGRGDILAASIDGAGARHAALQDVVNDTLARARRAVYVEWSGQPTGRWSQSRLPTPPWERASRERVRARGQAADSATDVFLSSLLPDEEMFEHEDNRPPSLEWSASGESRRPPGPIRGASQRKVSAPPSPTDFEYVVREQQKTRVAFGSAQSRAVLPLVGLAAGANRLTNLGIRATDDLRHLGPAEYSTPNLSAFYEILNKVTSKLGPGARTAQRFKEFDQHLPAPNTYTLIPLPPRPSRAPFNSTSRRPSRASSDTPGPGSYTLDALRRPGVPVVVRCGGGEGPGHCEVCDTPLELGVEFWATTRTDHIMCQDCMETTRKYRRRPRWQLEAYKKTRDCSDIHRHEGTTAKIYLIDPANVERRRRREAYLARYFREQRVTREKETTPSTEPARLMEVEVPTVHRVEAAPRDDYCCLHEAFGSFNKARMSFGVREPSDGIYGTLKRCALDRQPSPFSTAKGSLQQA